MSRSTWINFRELREKLKFLDVLHHYNVKFKPKGNRAAAPCPLPTHESRRKSQSFSADLERGIWQCFGCHAKGNVLDFACRMEGFNPANPHELREGALRIAQLFSCPASPRGATPPSPRKDASKGLPAAPANDAAKVIVNAPLDFELQTLDYGHPYLRERGFTDETIKYFGLGYCNRGMLKHRIAIPIHDANGRLVGYAGRLVDDRLICDENPKYRFPGDRDRDGVRYEFRKSELVYNVHRLPERSSDVIVVEGFASVWWLHQHGYANVVATMGSDCSDAQVQIVCDRTEVEGRVWLLFDGDDAGILGASIATSRIAGHRWTRALRLHNGEQATNCSSDDLQALLSI